MPATEARHGKTAARLWHRFLGGLPSAAVISLARALAECRWSPLRRLLIRGFVWGFRVDMAEAADPDLRAYESFNAFFTRALRAGSRPIGADTRIACPCDGRVAATGEIGEGVLLQAKGLDYRLEDLLGDREAAAAYIGGQYLTIYLAPHDYHRVHVPAPGRLHRLQRIPGRLHAVNASSAAVIPRLYVENERVVACFGADGAIGGFALVLVAAIGVSGIRLTRPAIAPRELPASVRHYPAHEGPDYVMGEEFGRFEMGSTVILLIPQTASLPLATLPPGSRVRMGMRLA